MGHYPTGIEIYTYHSLRYFIGNFGSTRLPVIVIDFVSWFFGYSDDYLYFHVYCISCQQFLHRLNWLR
jgi:hypothetical protein